VVPPHQKYFVRVVDLQDQQRSYHLDAELASVHVVPEKKILSFRRVAETLEKIEQIIELAVDITNYYYRTGNL
jgi:hypothetical protein